MSRRKPLNERKEQGASIPIFLNPNGMTQRMIITDNVKLRVKSNFSVPHLLGAAFFSRRVYAIEKDNLGKPLGSFWEEILAFSTACIFGCIASLESYANELFADHEKYFPDMRAEIMKKLWEFFEQKPLLEKYEFALLLKKAPSLNKDRKPYQDIAALIRLRNALTHFKPEWDDEQVAHAKISTQLKGRFSPSPFMGEGDPLFPKRWATSGCTKWALESTIAFLNDFEESAGLEHRLDKFIDRLGVE